MEIAMMAVLKMVAAVIIAEPNTALQSLPSVDMAPLAKQERRNEEFW
jgi:hypothetical protein